MDAPVSICRILYGKGRDTPYRVFASDMKVGIQTVTDIHISCEQAGNENFHSK